jgi:hypothetical protein
LALQDAMRSLNDAHNQEVNWAIGDLLRQRAVREDWRQCPILQHLDVGPPNLTSRARSNNVASGRSNLCAFAEMLGAQYLSVLSHGNIRFPSDEGPITADLMSAHNGITYVTEAKNLREPNSLTYVAFARWHRNRAADPEAFNFTAEFLQLEDPFEDLTAAQALAVRNLGDTLPHRERPSTFLTTLSGDRTVRVRVAEAEE